VTFVSYAQNFEDVMLWRALGHIEQGRYIDVGAQDPRVDSVSRAFYERGWRGLHVEPVPDYASRLRADRPGEIVLEAVIDTAPGTIALTVFEGTGLSSTVESVAERHRASHEFEHHQIQVPALTLNQAAQLLGGDQVHWLKIDVEGAEGRVLRGWDSQSLRPWVIVVEATVPLSRVRDDNIWSPIVLAAGYKLVYFDGLNNFYVAQEHAHLAEAFAVPPNVFDEVILSGLASSQLCRGVIEANVARSRELEARTHELENQARELENQTRELEQRGEELMNSVAETSRRAEAQWIEIEGLQLKLRHAHEQAENVQRTLQGVYASLSWKLTRPLRLANLALRRGLFGLAALRKQASQRMRGALRRVMRALMIKARKSPGLSKAALHMLQYFPSLKLRLSKIAHPYDSRAAGYALAGQASADGQEFLDEHAQELLARLRRARSRARKPVD